MEFSKVPDTCFTWTLNDFEEFNIDSLPEKSFSSANFTTLRDPSRKWQLLLSIDKLNQIYRSSSKCDNSNCFKKTITKKMVNLKILSNGLASNSENIRIDISMRNNFEKLTRSLIVSGSMEEYTYENFIDCGAMLKMVQEGKLEIFVEMFFPDEKNVKYLDIIRSSEFLSDVKILITDRTFYAHKAILAARSLFFYQLFQKEKEINEIKDLDIMPKVFTEILKYIYSDYVEKWYLSSDILIAANILKMENLKLECENYLRNNLTMDCINTILIVSVECDAKFLLKHCLNYALRNMSLLRNLKNFHTLKTKPLVVLRVLQEILFQLQNGKITIVDNINLSYSKIATNKSSYLLKEYESFLNNENLSDITIRVDERNFQCHKIILAAKSQVLRELLTNHMNGNLGNVMEFTDIKAEIFEEVLRYMYTGKVNNLQEYGIDILRAANQYKLEHLKNMCEEFLVAKLTHDNVVETLKIADACNAPFLVKHCSHYILKYIISNFQKKEFSKRINLDMFINCRHNIFYEFLNVLSKCCQVLYN